ncbi:hypothetical protein CMI37_05030 [Candidatus Pacearchaeota archaeon]|nr:hypothetical protein [Candidatus Pacearchaeota archaeon]|tara:strand:+ start:2922 stop:5840 length:2919 start_codon:yes stop_codon:yes gene_type:complete
MATERDILRSIDNFIYKSGKKAYEGKVFQLAEIAWDFLQKQHAKYAHLVPMYRTVHRKKPREITFRAIRWVNPKRMFPVSQMSAKEIAALTPEKRAEALSELAKYRREAHVIMNRYEEMLSLISIGERPYHINYGPVDFDELIDHKARAERLKQGTSNWEWALDKQAMVFRQEMGKQGEKFDDVADLWQDGLPPFFDARKGRAKQVPMRKLGKSIDPETGDLIKDPSIKDFRVNAREFLIVPPEELRPGENFWMPEKIMLAGDQQAGIPIRLPEDFAEGSGMANMSNFLDQEGQFRGETASGQKVRIGYEPIDIFDPANRRRNRWTQVDDLGARGRARHRGEESAAGAAEATEAREFAPAELPGRDPDEPHPAEDTRSPEEVAAAEEAIRVAARAGQWADDNISVGDGSETFNPTQVNADVMEKSSTFVESLGGEVGIAGGLPDTPVEGPDLAIEVQFGDLDWETEYEGRGLGAAVSGRVSVGGKSFMYKASAGEQLGENAAFVMDRALGLGIVPAVMLVNGLPDEWKDTGTADTPEGVTAMNVGLGGGFISEWIENLIPVAAVKEADLKKAMQDPENRAKFFGMIMLDTLLGNSDRHNSNFGFQATADGLKLIAYDNGFAGRFADINYGQQPADTGRTGMVRSEGVVKWEGARDSDDPRQTAPWMGSAHPQTFGNLGWDTWDKGNRMGAPPGGFLSSEIAGVDQAGLEQEIGNYIDEHFDMQVIGRAAAASGMKVLGQFMDGSEVTTEAAKAKIKEHILQAGLPGNEIQYDQASNYTRLSSSPPSEIAEVSPPVTVTEPEPVVVGQPPTPPLTDAERGADLRRRQDEAAGAGPQVLSTEERRQANVARVAAEQAEAAEQEAAEGASATEDLQWTQEQAQVPQGLLDYMRETGSYSIDDARSMYGNVMDRYKEAVDSGVDEDRAMKEVLPLLAGKVSEEDFKESLNYWSASYDERSLIGSMLEVAELRKRYE